MLSRNPSSSISAIICRSRACCESASCAAQLRRAMRMRVRRSSSCSTILSCATADGSTWSMHGPSQTLLDELCLHRGKISTNGEDGIDSRPPLPNCLESDWNCVRDWERSALLLHLAVACPGVKDRSPWLQCLLLTRSHTLQGSGWGEQSSVLGFISQWAGHRHRAEQLLGKTSPRELC